MIWPVKQKTVSSGGIDTALETPRLIVRPACLDDHAQWCDVRGRNRNFLKPFEPAWPENCLTFDFFKRRVLRLNQDWLADSMYGFLVFEKDDGRLIGGININNVTRGAAQYAALGYWLDQDHQGQGYMREAATSVLYFAFRDLRLARMNAATLPHNLKSRAMLAGLGFTEEGFARDYIQIDGGRQDHVLYGLNKDDFLGAAT